jgi:hypothetical protein
MSEPLNVPEAEERRMDCGDNSCEFEGRGRGGMRTNGGCYCLKDMDWPKRLAAKAYIRRLEAQAALYRGAQAEIDRLREELSMTWGDRALDENDKLRALYRERDEALKIKTAEWYAMMEESKTLRACYREAVEALEGCLYAHNHPGIHVSTADSEQSVWDVARMVLAKARNIECIGGHDGLGCGKECK